MEYDSVALLNGNVPGLPHHTIPAQNTAKHICFLMWDLATLYKHFIGSHLGWHSAWSKDFPVGISMHVS